MSSRGNLQRKCVKGHPKAAGRCSRRCIRYYPRLELPHGPDGTRRFESLGGYPTRTQAEAALADALARRSHGVTLDPGQAHRRPVSGPFNSIPKTVTIQINSPSQQGRETVWRR